MARRLIQIACEAFAPLSLPVRPDERGDQHCPDHAGNQPAPYQAAGPASAGRDDERDEGGDEADRTDDAVVDRRRGLEGHGRSESHGVAPTRAGDEAVQAEPGERHRVERLKLQMLEMRQAIGPEPPDRAGRDRAPVRTRHGPRERMHGECGSEQRSEQHGVVADRHAPGQHVKRPGGQRHNGEVIRVRQRLACGMEDVGVEDATGEEVERGPADRGEIPAQNPEIEVGIAGSVQRPEHAGR